jgi:2-polyprenyl-6-methoxyphenol hydroxylase-like FAD-dependent oxidoreductase
MFATRLLTSSTSPAFQVEVAVIGAGVVGLAIARSLAKAGKEVLLLERASAICTGTPSCLG